MVRRYSTTHNCIYFWFLFYPQFTSLYWTHLVEILLPYWGNLIVKTCKVSAELVQINGWTMSGIRIKSIYNFGQYCISFFITFHLISLFVLNSTSKIYFPSSVHSCFIGHWMSAYVRAIVWYYVILTVKFLGLVVFYVEFMLCRRRKRIAPSSVNLFLSFDWGHCI